MFNPLKRFRWVWAMDSEYIPRTGDRVIPVCLTARELRSRRMIQLWADELGSEPPFDVSPASLFIVYNATAEMSFFLACGWPMPVNVLDLFTEEKNLRNGYYNPKGTFELLNVLGRYHVPHITSFAKEACVQRILAGFPFTLREQHTALHYCLTDTEETAGLAGKMWPSINNHFPLALLRGRYMKAASQIEFNGVPIDAPLHIRMTGNWDRIKLRLVEQIDKRYNVYDGLSFRQEKFEALLTRWGVGWARTETGLLKTDDDTFEKMSLIDPRFSDLRKLRQMLGTMRLNALELGPDGFNRSYLFPFGSRTGRNTPGNTKFIFGPGSWYRGMIKPKKGWGVAYIDWRAQEFGIAASLSRDRNMMEAYLSGDCYLAFAKMAGAVPPDATKKTHRMERELFKTCVLGVQYGMEYWSLSQRIKKPPVVARELLAQHRSIFRQYWAWSDNQTDCANLRGSQQTVFGWTNHVSVTFKERSARNFPMQANGAEMLRLACCLGVEAGIRICAPVHDAILIMAPLECFEETIRQMQDIMEEASRIVLGGFTVEAECKEEARVRYPDRYMDPRDGSRAFWDRVMALLEEVENEEKETMEWRRSGEICPVS